jgi:hypothetical protein
MKGIEDVEENLNYCEDLACNLKIYKNMKSILLMPDELYVYNINNSYHKRKSSIEEIEKKIQDTIYVYNNLFLSTKDFQIKDRKLYKKIAAIKMIEKITILLEELIKSKLSKKELISEIEKIMSDKKVEEAINVLKDEDISSICDELKGLNKHTKKGIILLLNQKYNALYTYNKNIFLYIKTKFKNE